MIQYQQLHEMFCFFFYIIIISFKWNKLGYLYNIFYQKVWISKQILFVSLWVASINLHLRQKEYPQVTLEIVMFWNFSLNVLVGFQLFTIQMKIEVLHYSSLREGWGMLRVNIFTVTVSIRSGFSLLNWYQFEDKHHKFDLTWFEVLRNFYLQVLQWQTNCLLPWLKVSKGHNAIAM